MFQRFRIMHKSLACVNAETFIFSGLKKYQVLCDDPFQPGVKPLGACPADQSLRRIYTMPIHYV